MHDLLFTRSVVSHAQLDSDISVGSVLTEVNGTRVEGQSYVSTVASLKEWRPPLQLWFRAAPTCGGFLRELTPTSNKWKVRYC